MPSLSDIFGWEAPNSSELRMAVGHPFGALRFHQAAMYSKGVFACWEGSTRPKDPSGPEMCQGQDLR